MKKYILSLFFCIITIFLFFALNEILIPKGMNRYYILEQKINDLNKNFDIQVYGSCHAYTSFNPMYLKEKYNLDAYVYANPGEIIPTTYLRMVEQFKKYVPKTAVVEIWGINAYDTYDETEKILGEYLTSNIELIPLSLAKLEVIKDFNLDFLEMNFHIFRYKERIVDKSLSELDFDYEFEKTKDHTIEYYYSEMISRLENNGYKLYENHDVTNYYIKRKLIEEQETLEIEQKLLKYIYKIIELCKKYNVKLVFYRSPYLANENELKKANYFQEIVKKYNNITFIDLEKEIKYNYKEDYYDENHLSINGANKSTEYIAKFL